ncbi:MAG TPA: hypothetical protein VG758_07605 [Hyphomicrobiaceae bacterium]|jgi:hypothetical protein|nr:hypothetical protein [Hyphomicrobiaceae bacterium]
MPGTSLTGTSLVVAEHPASRAGPRTAIYLLVGLAISGWVGFLVLAGVLLAARLGPEVQGSSAEAAPTVISTFARTQERAQQPPPRPIAILTTYEERRRIQEWVQQWDTADHQDGNVAAARNVYEHATRKGWAPAALALALAYDPHELTRRGVQIAADPAKARACYTKARELMNAMVAYYLSRLPPETGESC